MITFEDIIEKLALDGNNLGSQQGNQATDIVRLRLAGDEVSLKAFDNFSEKITKAFGEATDKDDQDGDKSWTWNIDGNSIHLYLFEQHCLKLSLTISRAKV